MNISKLNRNQIILEKNHEISNGEIKVAKNSDLKSNMVFNYCLNCDKRFTTLSNKVFVFCCVNCAKEYHKRKMGLV